MAAPAFDVCETLSTTANMMDSPTRSKDAIQSKINPDGSDEAQIAPASDPQLSEIPLFKVPAFSGFRVVKPGRQPIKTENKTGIDFKDVVSLPQVSLRCDESMEIKHAIPGVREAEDSPVAPVAQNPSDTITEQHPVKTQPASKTGCLDKTLPPLLPYKEPQWSGLPTKEYWLEVLKGGQIVDRVDLSGRSYTVFGRLSSCDVTLEHPSISRHHAVVQHRLEQPEQPENPKKRPAGIYLYDLGSTHGTQLNKKLVKSHTYYQLHVGHMVRFGGSTRMFILQGPCEDVEPESELTVTELKELRREEEERLKREEEAEAAKEAEDAAKLEKDESNGVDWGMGEDATEEDDLEHNPFALDAPSANEEIYLDDPKKTLRGWFEREGYELEYEIEEKGTAHFLCKVQLPLDTPSGSRFYAEASVKGKKKEAVVACALEACRILDRRGLLRQATHESRERKLKNWEEDDYYDSDEDTYLDQTGTIEKKRQQRIQKAGKASDGGIETYDSLVEKHSKVLTEIQEIESTLAVNEHKALEAARVASDQDELDAYMASIQGAKSVVDKKTKTRLKLRLSQLKQDESKLRKLVNIAKPASLPPLQPIIPSPVKHEPIKPEPQAESKPAAPATRVSGSPLGVATEQPYLAPPVKGKFKGPALPPKLFSAVVSPPAEPMETDSPVATTPTKVAASTKEKEAPESDRHLVDDVSADAVDDTNSLEDKSLSKRKDTRDRKAIKRAKEKEKYVYDNTDPNYAMWLPPDDQSGDGKTSLNDKFGY